MIGIFWDCDGTIMDTERLYAYAWQSHLKQYGLDISEDEIRQFVGVDDRIVHSFYSDSVDIENFETTMLSLGNIIQESLNDKLLYNDSKILLNQINKLDIKQACVSASPHELLNKKLQEVQIDKLFEYIIGGDMVKRNKPYPDIYNKAIENLQTTKNIIIEDSPTGIQSGKNTNSFVLAVNRGIFSPDQLDQADLIVDDLCKRILDDFKLDEKDKVSIMINSLGATPLEELYIVSKRVNENFSELKIDIMKSYVGRYATSMEMAGMSITILKLDDELKKYLLEPSQCPFWNN